MAECNACGALVSHGEHFCGNCGTQQLPPNSELRTIAANLSESGEVQAVDASAVAEPAAVEEVTEAPAEAAAQTGEPIPISSNSLGGSFTDNIGLSETTAEPRGTGGHRPAVKQLDSNTILNHRYEVVRGVLADACAERLRIFFAALRAQGKK